MEEVSCRKANLDDAGEAKAIMDLLDHYATDLMGGGEPLSAYVHENLIRELRARPTAHIFLAFIDKEPVGLANCFEGFSTFACKPLLNIHDFVVSAKHRRKGVGTALMSAVEAFARSIGCCKLTLEVLEGNPAAQQLYKSCGFEGYELAAETGKALLWQKKF